MNIFSRNFRIILCVSLVGLITSCTKYTEIKSDETYYTINSISDLNSLLDNTSIMNTSQPNTPEIASDNFFILSNDWSSLSSLTHKNCYIWDKDVYNESKNNDWFYIYRTVSYSNIVLDNINRFSTSATSAEINAIKSAALFYRSWSLFQAIQIWSAPYDSSKSDQLLGVPLRTSSDFNEVSTRATLENSYQFIITDLKEAVNYLPEYGSYKTRPSKGAAFGLLARIFLARQEYEQAGAYADSCLQTNSNLLDFNDLSASSNSPVPKFNEEVIFHTTAVSALILNNPRGKIDTALYSSYHLNDLRKQIYFRASSGYQSFKGSYDGSTALFTGLAVDEIYLTKAEVLARTGYAGEGIDLLNALLRKRYLTGTFVPVTASSDGEALRLILEERRKELPYRHIRWMDIKRLNRNASTATVITRMLNNQNYVLSPNDSKYAFQIPEFIIQNSDVIQNP